MAMLLQRSGIFSDVELPRKTLLTLNNQRQSSKFCDIVLRVCGTQIYAHACVLAAASPYFCSFLGTGSDCPRAFSQKQPQVIEIHIDNVLISEGDGGYGEAVCKVVEYMYTNEITITTNLFSQIIEIGRIMLLDQLLLYCDEFQKGVNGNKPIDVSTCTSTLKEVVNILGINGKTVKRADAQTETEDTLFEKVKDQSYLEADPLPSSEFDLLFNEKTSVTNAPINVTVTGLDMSICDDRVEKENKPVISITSKIESVIKEEDVETPRDVQQQNNSNSFENVESSNSNIVIEEKPIVLENEMKGLQQLPADSEPEENFNAIKSFEDILEYGSISAEQSSVVVDELIGEKVNDEQLTENIPDTETVTDVELEDISDLVTFNSVASASSKIKSRGSGRSRGRSRSRKRGRGRPKGKRKVERNSENNAESDYEFEQFIVSLEKGETVESHAMEVEEQETKQKPEDNTSSSTSAVLQQSKIIDKGNPPVTLKKSDRVRSRPSQFQKDYILHSLTRKTRKKFDTTLHDRTPIQPSEFPTESKDNGLRFVCQKCDYSTTVFKAYVGHLNAHPEMDPKCFLCHKCGFKTTKARLFKRHKEKHMADEMICAFCLFQASTSVEYKEHKLKHSGNLPYFCNECDSRFKKKSQLESHQPKHWLQRPFICPVCKAGFKWKHALKNHMITHTTVKDHLCDICGYATAHKSMLTSHRLVHTGETFKCSVEGCHFEATKRQKLKMHMLTHTREKPHQCEVCGQRFSLAKNMRRHLLLHTNTRPFACKICSFTTTRYDKLKEHNHKLHNIGGPSVPKKTQVEDVLFPNVPATATIVTAENITLNPDGTISAESLQKIAELAAAQQKGSSDADELSLQETTINIEQSDAHGNSLPIIAHIQYSEPRMGETESIQYLEDIE